MSSILPTANNDQEQPPAVVRAPTMVDRVQRFIGHEFALAHPRHSSIAANKSQDGIDNFSTNSSAIRRRMTVQNTRSNINPKDAIIEINNDCNESSSVPER
jgi:hypothetical protein